jgi:hypothetical protein
LWIFIEQFFLSYKKHLCPPIHSMTTTTTSTPSLEFRHPMLRISPLQKRNRIIMPTTTLGFVHSDFSTSSSSSSSSSSSYCLDDVHSIFSVDSSGLSSSSSFGKEEEEEEQEEGVEGQHQQQTETENTNNNLKLQTFQQWESWNRMSSQQHFGTGSFYLSRMRKSS